MMTAAAPPLEAPPVRASRRSAQALLEARFAALLVAPAMAAIALVAFYPLGHALWLSFWKINLRFANTPWVFVGLGNYVDAITDDARWLNALRVTLTIAFTSLLAEFVLGMIFALVMNQSFRGRALVRASVLIPWSLTTVVSARMWQVIYHASYGVFNRILVDVGLIDAYKPWIISPVFTIWAMIGADVWKTTPFVALLLTAGMQLIPGELYEAAAIDGATAWDRFWRITFPLLRPTMLVALLFRMIDVFRMLDLPFVLTGGGPGQATETLSLYTYRVIFTDLKFGGGSALAVLTFLMILGTAFVFIKVLGAPVAGAESER
jgi:multiple sugar transport system permease protein